VDPFTATTTFATLIGLLCNFRQEKGDREALDHQKFSEWLQHHRHEELTNLISNTAALRTEIDSLLRSDHAQMIQKLDQIGAILLRLLSRVDQFRGLAVAIAPSIDLSEQAISILRQLVNSGCESFHYSNFGGGDFCLQILGKDEGIGITEVRFLEDDLNQLTELQLLTPKYSSQGDPIFHVTRNAIRFIEVVDEKSEA